MITEGKTFFDATIQEFIRNDRLKHPPDPTVTNDNSLTFNEAFYQRYQQERRTRELNKTNPNVANWQSKPRRKAT